MNITASPKTQFVTLAIGATAKHLGVSTTELYNRLKHHDLVHLIWNN